MSAVGEFIDSSLQNETGRHGSAGISAGLQLYGTSVGAVRGIVRDAARKFPGLAHDEITALSSELWGVPVFERRLAAIVLLQANVQLLIATDLTRLEGFIRSAIDTEALLAPLIDAVIVPLFAQLQADDRVKANGVLSRWSAADEDPLVRAARSVFAASA